MEFIDEFVKTVLQIAAPVIASLAVGVLVQLARKLGLEIGAEKEARLKGQARAAILSTEERAATLLKHHATKLTQHQKLQQTLSALMVRVPGLSHEEAQRLIQQELPRVGAGAASSAGTFLQSVRSAATSGPTS